MNDDALLAALLARPETRTEYVDRNITITENRAPTDESLKILRDMQEKVRDALILKGPFAANGFKGELSIFREPYALSINAILAVAAFELNGRKMKVEVRFEPDHRDAVGERMRKLGCAIGEALAKEVSSAIFDDILGKLPDTGNLLRALAA